MRPSARTVFRRLLVATILLLSQHAYARPLEVQCSLLNGGQMVNTDIPDLAVSPSTPENTIIWESPVQDLNFRCWDGRQGFPLWFTFIGVGGPDGTGVAVGIRYDGNLYIRGRRHTVPVGDQTGDTGIYQRKYSIVVIKLAATPSGGVINFNNFNLIQVDGTIQVNNNEAASRLRHRINGSVRFWTGGTCAIAANSGQQTIKLPTIGSRALPDPGSTAGRVHFQISLNNCSETVRSARFIFSGTPASGDASFFNNTGSATGVALRLAENSGQRIISPSSADNNVTVAVVNRQAVLPLMAEYVSTGVVTPGTLRALTTLMITYQ